MSASHLRRFVAGLLAASIVFALSFSAGCLPVGPMGLIAGGRLRGTPHQGAEPSWSNFAELRTLELQVSPEGPRSVNVGVLVLDERLFVPATLRPDEKRWPQAIAKDDRVVARIDGVLFARKATRVRAEPLIDRLLAAGQAKYDPTYFEPDKTWFFELSPRP